MGAYFAVLVQGECNQQPIWVPDERRRQSQGKTKIAGREISGYRELGKRTLQIHFQKGKFSFAGMMEVLYCHHIDMKE